MFQIVLFCFAIFIHVIVLQFIFIFVLCGTVYIRYGDSHKIYRKQLFLQTFYPIIIPHLCCHQHVHTLTPHKTITSCQDHPTISWLIQIHFTNHHRYYKTKLVITYTLSIIIHPTNNMKKRINCLRS